ncbi:translation initiation factor IF-3 [Candidatus Falkowbacteria bacterium RIFOXYC2_FULL_48_21]|uniref:Translation initiation factor IF-3 n=1 Tax=Candidatus Falkowbacteria bacterium RIFOXYC2_FULL_48_21 TaxID=1798005 RepID=A0A1F5TIA2_9BACT|nr:MAG: translation initiation factor IF-3 [Candidatus Falkowbacteria bacterium RIFOXYC2_FULL_48_21]
MRKSYKFQRKVTNEKIYRANLQISAPSVSVIDEQGAQIGQMSTREAIQLAEDRGLDLVEVSPLANPPVAKIMNFGSFQYQHEKLLKKQRLMSRSLEMKNIRLSLQIGDHDKEVRIIQSQKFLEKGHKIKLEIILKGRELSHMDIARQVLRSFQTALGSKVIVEQDVSKQGNKLFLILAPQE